MRSCSSAFDGQALSTLQTLPDLIKTIERDRRRAYVGRPFVRRDLERSGGIEVLLREGYVSAAHSLILVVTSLSLLLGRTCTSRIAIVGSGKAFVSVRPAAAVFQSASDCTSRRDSSFAARSWWPSTIAFNIVAIEIRALLLDQLVGDLPVLVVELHRPFDRLS